MKVFIWEKVLCDYTCGMIVVIADDLEKAMALIHKQEYDYVAAEMERVEPTIIEMDDSKAQYFIVSGGGR